MTPFFRSFELFQWLQMALHFQDREINYKKVTLNVALLKSIGWIVNCCIACRSSSWSRSLRADKAKHFAVIMYKQLKSSSFWLHLQPTFTFHSKYFIFSFFLFQVIYISSVPTRVLFDARLFSSKQENLFYFCNSKWEKKSYVRCHTCIVSRFILIS